MTLEDSSSLKVPYDLRPAKQAERKMLVDVLFRLSSIGFPIRTYHYVGFGAIFFHDFRLLHKLIGIESMTSIEGYKKMLKRCRYNLPFSSVSLFDGLASEYIPLMSADILYLAWFDYDATLNRSISDDVVGVLSTLRPWSIFVVTVDLEKPKNLKGDKPSDYESYYKEELPQFVSSGLTVNDFRPQHRERTIRLMLERCIEQGMRARAGLSFEYLIRASRP